MGKQTIAVDADDTIFDENNAVRLFMNDTYGFNHDERDYLVDGPFETYWENIWGFDPKHTQEVYQEFCLSPYKENLKPIKNAINVLTELKQQYELVIVTSRDHRLVDITHKALAEHYPSIFSDVHFMPLWGNSGETTKAKLCNEIGASYLIDDSFEHCKLCSGTNTKAIVFGDYGWNRKQTLPDGLVRCKDWDAVGKLVIN
jgi:uncharacterized HAD superfamily protein